MVTAAAPSCAEARNASARAAVLAGLALLLALRASSAGAEGAASPSATAVASPRPRILVMVLDAVPYRTLLEVIAASRSQGEPLFPDLQVPLPLVSSFPSTTTVALAGSFMPLGMPQPPGYEARFFDWRPLRVRGGGPISYNRIDTHWADFFHWHVENPLRKGFGFLRPRKFARFEIRRGLEEFLSSDRDVFLTYVSATDGAGHLHGPDSLAPLLRVLDEELRAAREREPFVTVLLSDHGMEGSPRSVARARENREPTSVDGAHSRPLLNLRRTVKRALRQDGYRLRKRLLKPEDVVWVRFGLLTSAVFFTAEERQQDVARRLARIEGVDVCAVRAGPQRWRVWGGTGGADEVDVQRRAAPGGHELLLRGSRSVLGEDLPHGEWLEEGRWLQRTAFSARPDAPYRVMRAFDLVENPASVACSLDAGFMIGSWLTDWSGRLTVGRLRHTHGSLNRAASLGFFMTDAPWWSSADRVAVRFDDVLLEVLPTAWQR